MGKVLGSSSVWEPRSVRCLAIVIGVVEGVLKQCPERNSPKRVTLWSGGVGDESPNRVEDRALAERDEAQLSGKATTTEAKPVVIESYP